MKKEKGKGATLSKLVVSGRIKRSSGRQNGSRLEEEMMSHAVGNERAAHLNSFFPNTKLLIAGLQQIKFCFCVFSLFFGQKDFILWI